MKRGSTGRYNTTTVGGEQVRAFVPSPLPPAPPLDLSAMYSSLENALLALGRLDGLSNVLPDIDLFLYSYVRKEAVLSSEIEGTQSSLSDLLLYELEVMPGAPIDDVVEVSNYVRALEYGLSRMRGGFPLSSRLIRETHGQLLARGRGSDKDPGEFRRSQNWIGGSRPATAYFVPPPAREIPECMGKLEQFFHSRDSGLPALIRAGISHVQFETIHPFLDGNGRVGRLLITFLLFNDTVLREPLLYLSLYFKQHRQNYYDLLDRVRRTGEWEEWIAFFLDGVTQTAEGAITTAQRLMSLFEDNEARIQLQGRGAGSALRVHQVLKERPITSLQNVAERAALSYHTAASGMRMLEALGVAQELTGRKRGRLYGYQDYLAIMNEGTEPL